MPARAKDEAAVEERIKGRHGIVLEIVCWLILVALISAVAYYR
jgi:hypothetical protein